MHFHFMQLLTSYFSIFRDDRCWELHWQIGLLTQGQSCYEDMFEINTICYVTKLLLSMSTQASLVFVYLMDVSL